MRSPCHHVMTLPICKDFNACPIYPMYSFRILARLLGLVFMDYDVAISFGLASEPEAS